MIGGGSRVGIEVLFFYGKGNLGAEVELDGCRIWLMILMFFL